MRLLAGFFRIAGRGVLLGCLSALTVLAFLGFQLGLVELCRRLGQPIPPGCAAATSAIAVALLLGSVTSRRVLTKLRQAADSVRHRFLRPDEVEVKCSIQRVRADNYRMAGSLEALPFGIVVQCLHAAWQTGVLLAEFDGRLGKVYFDRGKITEIRYGRSSGPEAFNLMYRDFGGVFLFQPGKGAPKPGAEQDVMGLLTAALRHHQGAEASMHRYVRPLLTKQTV